MNSLSASTAGSIHVFGRAQDYSYIMRHAGSGFPKFEIEKTWQISAGSDRKAKKGL
jgi:hypothetical protein